jgi:hypothetical protein
MNLVVMVMVWNIMYFIDNVTFSYYSEITAIIQKRPATRNYYVTEMSRQWKQ